MIRITGGEAVTRRRSFCSRKQLWLSQHLEPFREVKPFLLFIWPQSLARPSNVLMHHLLWFRIIPERPLGGSRIEEEVYGKLLWFDHAKGFLSLLHLLVQVERGRTVVVVVVAAAVAVFWVGLF